MSTVLTKSLPAPPFCEREALRYAGCRAADGQTTGLLHACLDQAQDALAYRVCYTVSPVEIREAEVTFEGFTLRSAQLARNLAGCSRALVFAATVGVGIDRLIARAGALSPAKGLMYQAIGAERIESLCDSFCALFEQEQGVSLRPRFSPGYGDLPLEAQRAVFEVLDCPRRIGLTLGGGLVMSPSKSVTAIAGITARTEKKPQNKCARCRNAACLFRSETWISEPS